MRRSRTFFWSSEKKRLHRRVVPGRADSAHRSDHVVTAQSADEFPAAKLRSSIRVDHATGHVAAPGDGVVQRRDREPGLHPRVDRVAHDPVGVDVLERADVKLALVGPMFRDVADPQLVRAVGSEHVPGPAVLVDDGAQVVVDRWPGLLAVLAALLTERDPPAVVRADPPRSPRCHRLAGISGFVDQVPVAELGIIAVGVEQGVGTVGLVEFRRR